MSQMSSTTTPTASPVLAAQAARQLDASVTVPGRLPVARQESADHPPDEAADKRLAHIRRHLAVSGTAPTTKRHLDAASRVWLTQLHAEGPAREAAVGRLHALLLREARHEVRRRTAGL